jgi:hypothetical protein
MKKMKKMNKETDLNVCIFFYFFIFYSVVV